jgi:hypothetical protein
MEQSKNKRRRLARDWDPDEEVYEPPEPGSLGDLYSSPSGFEEPHPDHGPARKLPRRADGTIDRFYYYSREQIREFGFRPGMSDPPDPNSGPDPVPAAPQRTGTGFFYKDGREMPPTHPDHGPMADIPVDEDGRVPAYYYCSKEEIEDFGLGRPPPRRCRVDGWTPDRQETFVKTLATTGTWGGAAAMAGRSRQSATDLYNRSPAFRAACNEALRATNIVLHATAVERAVEGVREPVFYKGEKVGERIRYNDRLLMFLLRVRDPLNFAPLADIQGWLRHRGIEQGGGVEPALDRLAAAEEDWGRRLPGEEVRPRTIANPVPPLGAELRDDSPAKALPPARPSEPGGPPPESGEEGSYGSS